jgi:hypothetical protein
MFNSIAGLLFIWWLNILPFLQPVQKVIYKTNNGNIKFVSEAPLETITASSNELRGIIDTVKSTFAFSVSINSFKGFNSDLQQEHFYENYLESSDYPVATFSGKIIEIVDYSRPGLIQVRAKGMLNIHGVKVERIIKSSITIREKDLIIHSKFIVNLQDHNIKIPRIVYQKIAPDITVEIEAALLPSNIQ